MKTKVERCKDERGRLWKGEGITLKTKNERTALTDGSVGACVAIS